MKKTVFGCILMVSVLCICSGCAPSTFVKNQLPGWKVVELNDSLAGQYNDAWMKTVDTIARDYDIEMLDKDSGYLRTVWAYGISGGTYNRYRARITVKYPEVKVPVKIELKTEAQWLDSQSNNRWVRGFDRNFQRDVYTALSGRLGRVVSTE